VTVFARTYLLVTALLFSLASAAAQQADGFDFLDGVWVATSPPGPHIVFTKVALGVREVSLPTIGQASVRPSNGEQGSNVKVSGAGFDCFYYVTPLASRRAMVWELKGGSSVCMPNSAFEKVVVPDAPPPPPPPRPQPSPPPPPPPASRAYNCIVADPTSTPLNVRDSPYGNIQRTLSNGVRVRAIDARDDNRGVSWSRITDSSGSVLGWVLTRYLSCSSVSN